MPNESPRSAQVFELERATKIVIWVDSKHSLHEIGIPRERALQLLDSDVEGWTLHLRRDGSVEMEQRGDVTEELITRESLPLGGSIDGLVD